MENVNKFKLDDKEYTIPCKCYLYNKKNNTITDGEIMQAFLSVNSYYDEERDLPSDAWKKISFSIGFKIDNMSFGTIISYGFRGGDPTNIYGGCIDNHHDDNPIIFLDEKSAYKKGISDLTIINNKNNEIINKYKTKIKDVQE